MTGGEYKTLLTKSLCNGRGWITDLANERDDLRGGVLSRRQGCIPPSSSFSTPDTDHEMSWMRLKLHRAFEPRLSIMVWANVEHSLAWNVARWLTTHEFIGADSTRRDFIFHSATVCFYEKEIFERIFCISEPALKIVIKSFSVGLSYEIFDQITSYEFAISSKFGEFLSYTFILSLIIIIIILSLKYRI